MRRRFGRRRSPSSEAAPVDPQSLQRLVELDTVPIRSLDPVGADDIPASLAALGLGESDAGERILAGFGHNAVDALLATTALAMRLHEQSQFAGQAWAVAPDWSGPARACLGLLRAGLPVSLRALAVPALGEGEVEPAPEAAGVVPVGAVLRRPARVDVRALLERSAEALAGLAAKHGAALRGHGSTLELVVLGRRLAVLRADEAEVTLDLLLPRRSSLAVSAEGLSDVLDRLEGLVRKHRNDRRVREGEEAWRWEMLDALARSAGLRDLTLSPAGGATSTSWTRSGSRPAAHRPWWPCGASSGSPRWARSWRPAWPWSPPWPGSSSTPSRPCGWAARAGCSPRAPSTPPRGTCCAAWARRSPCGR